MQSRGGEILRKWKIPISGFYGFYGLLWDIKDTTEYNGTFHKKFIDSEPRHQKKSLETLIFEKNREIEPNYFGYYGILRILRKLL